VRRGKDGVGAFFEAFGNAMDVDDFTPLTFASNADGDVLTVVRFAVRSRETGKAAKMQLHHWFRFTNGKISYYRGTEDTAITVATLTA
jgi:ketosteroid isomerase-like protein